MYILFNRGPISRVVDEVGVQMDSFKKRRLLSMDLQKAQRNSKISRNRLSKPKNPRDKAILTLDLRPMHQMIAIINMVAQHLIVEANGAMERPDQLTRRKTSHLFARILAHRLLLLRFIMGLHLVLTAHHLVTTALLRTTRTMTQPGGHPQDTDHHRRESR